MPKLQLSKELIHEKVPSPPFQVAPSGISTPSLPRAADVLDDIVSLKMTELFPDIDRAIITQEMDKKTIREVIRKETEKATAHIDLSKVKPGDKVHLLISEHGFIPAGGWAYCEQIKYLDEMIRERTGAKVSLCYSVAGSPQEANDILAPNYDILDHFKGRFVFSGRYEETVGVETDIGKMYLMKKPFNCDWVVNMHYDTPRENHFHRYTARALKAFGMSYAAPETRSSLHSSWEQRTASLVHRVMYESQFVQSKFLFGTILLTSPDGVTGLLADRDFIKIEKEMEKRTMRNFAKWYHVLRHMKNYMVVIDGYRWGDYIPAGGMETAAVTEGFVDMWDLDLPQVRVSGIRSHEYNKESKAYLFNNCWPCLFKSFLHYVPNVYWVKEVEDALMPMYPVDSSQFQIRDNIKVAVDEAIQKYGTDRIIIFNDSYGSVSVSRSLAEHILELVPEATKEADEVLYPKYMKQRNIAI